VGYNPQALLEMLTEMQKQLKPGEPDFAKTHPDPEDRIDDIMPDIGTSPSGSTAAAARQKRFARATGPV
jgi:predicted Zn-dependent protease